MILAKRVTTVILVILAILGNFERAEIPGIPGTPVSCGIRETSGIREMFEIPERRATLGITVILLSLHTRLQCHSKDILPKVILPGLTTLPSRLDFRLNKAMPLALRIPNPIQARIAAFLQVLAQAMALLPTTHQVLGVPVDAVTPIICITIHPVTIHHRVSMANLEGILEVPHRET